MKKKITFLIIFLFILGCGFKTFNYDETIPIKINSINYSGHKYLNFILKSKLQTLKKENSSNASYNLNIDSSVNKSIYEKNIRNEITKYQLNFNVKITFIDQYSNIVKTFSINKTHNFDVGDYQTQTRTRERNNINRYSSIIGDEIIKRIVLEANDL